MENKEEIIEYIERSVNKVRGTKLYNSLLSDEIDESKLLTQMFRVMQWKLPVLRKEGLDAVIVVDEDNITVDFKNCDEFPKLNIAYANVIERINISTKESQLLFQSICNEFLSGDLHGEIFEHICRISKECPNCKGGTEMPQKFCDKGLTIKSSKYTEIINKELMDKNPLILVNNLAVINISNESVGAELIDRETMIERLRRYKEVIDSHKEKQPKDTNTDETLYTEETQKALEKMVKQVEDEIARKN